MQPIHIIKEGKHAQTMTVEARRDVDIWGL